MRFVHGLHAALRFPCTTRFLHFDEASRWPAPQPMTHGRGYPSHPAVRPSAAPRFGFKETAMFKTTLATAVIAVAASFATPAIAGQCPTPGANPLANAPTMPKGVTDTVIGSIDLGGEINVDGRQLRTRRLVVQPG